MKSSELEEIINQCLNELEKASKGECSPDKADRNAALFLVAQMKLASHIAEVELKTKLAKSEVERISSEKYFEFKKEGVSSGKPTEAALEHAVLKDGAISDLKKEMLTFEADLKKWNYIINIMSNGHIYFRGISKKEFGI